MYRLSVGLIWFELSIQAVPQSPFQLVSWPHHRSAPALLISNQRATKIIHETPFNGKHRFLTQGYDVTSMRGNGAHFFEEVLTFILPRGVIKSKMHNSPMPLTPCYP